MLNVRKNGSCREKSLMQYLREKGFSSDMKAASGRGGALQNNAYNLEISDLFPFPVLPCSVRRILRCDPPFPSMIGSTAQDLLKKLLVKDPHKRLGSGPRGSEDIKAHPFFKVFLTAVISNSTVFFLSSSFYSSIQVSFICILSPSRDWTGLTWHRRRCRLHSSQSWKANLMLETLLRSSQGWILFTLQQAHLQAPDACSRSGLSVFTFILINKIWFCNKTPLVSIKNINILKLGLNYSEKINL